MRATLYTIVLFLIYSRAYSNLPIQADTIVLEGYYISMWEHNSNSAIESGFFYDSVFQREYSTILTTSLHSSMRKYGVIDIFCLSRSLDISKTLNDCYYGNKDILPVNLDYSLTHPIIYPFPFYKYIKHNKYYYTICKVKCKYISINLKIDCPILLIELDYDSQDMYKFVTLLIPIERLEVNYHIENYKMFNLKIATRIR